MRAQATEHLSLRISPAELEEIDLRAQARGITRTKFLIDSALERLPETQESVQAQLDAICRRLDRIDRLYFDAS